MNSSPSSQTADILSDDMLAEVFSYLEGDELLAAESVNSKWHQIVETLNWQKLFIDKIKSCPTWREVYKRHGNQNVDSKSDYKARYHDVHRKVKELDQNWRSGRFSERDIEIDDAVSVCADTHFLVNNQDTDVAVYERQKLEILRVQVMKYDADSCLIDNGVLILTGNKFDYDVVDAKSGSKLLELPRRGRIDQVAYRGGILAVVSEYNLFGSMLQLWQRKDEGFQLRIERPFPSSCVRLNLDDRFMALYEGDPHQQDDDPDFRQFDVFFSVPANSETVRSFGVCVKDTTFHYDQGIFFLIQKRGIIRLLEVSSGQWIRSIQHQPWQIFFDASQTLRWKIIATNSKYFATMNRDHFKNTTVRIFDLLAARKPSAEANSNFLLATIIIPDFHYRHFKMSETEIYGVCVEDLYVLQFFKSLDFLNPGADREVISNISRKKRVERKQTRRPPSKLAVESVVSERTTRPKKIG